MRERYVAQRDADPARSVYASRFTDSMSPTTSNFCDSLSSPLDLPPGMKAGRYALERDSFLPDKALKTAFCLLILATVALCAWVLTRAWMEL